MRETGMMKIEHIANLRKLEYYIDLNSRDEGRLEVKLKDITERNNLSYYREIEELREFYKIKNNLKNICPKRGKLMLKQKVKKKNDEEIQKDMMKGKKTSEMGNYSNKYMQSLDYENARILFMALTGMIKVKTNFKNNFKQNLKCEMCDSEDETIMHLFECNKYEKDFVNIRKGKSIQEILEKNSEKRVAKP